MSKVSLVIPVRNRAEQLERAILSAEAIPSIAEIIVIDDHSSPRLNGADFINLIPGKKIKLISNSIGVGAQSARVLGVQEATQEFVLFLDSDDILLPRGVSELHSAALGERKFDLFYGNLTDTVSTSDFIRVRGGCFKVVLKNLSLCPFSGLLARRSKIRTDLLDLSLPAWQDDDFCLVMSRFSLCFFVDTVTAQIEYSNDSISKSKENQLIGLLKLTQKWSVEIRENFGLRMILLWRLRVFIILLRILKIDLERSSVKTFPVRISLKFLHLFERALVKLVSLFFDRIYA